MARLLNVRCLLFIALCKVVLSICRFGSWSHCAFPCNCYWQGCNQETGNCSYGGCAYGQPYGEIYRWHGSACRKGNVAYNKPAVMAGDPYKQAGKTLYAHLAVDGSVSQEPRDCARTADSSVGRDNRAWMYVDLGGLHKVERLTLFNRKYTWDNKAAVLGKMKIGLTNSTNINDWTPFCFHLTGHVPNAGTATFPCTTNNVGRYFYLYRDEDGYEKFRVNVCEIILDGYPVIECGPQCETTCNEVTGCDKCKPGYKYPDCKQACEPGKWGDNCEQRCSYNCAGQECDKANGRCISCRYLGYHGDNCAKRCPHNCKDSVCDRDSGVCTRGCNLYYWGAQCQNNCNFNCQQTRCNSSTGYCSNGCNYDLYWGNTCETTCNHNCISNVCNMKDGYCSTGCNNGYYGPQCNSSCPSNCNHNICARESGNCEYGCTGSYVGDICKRLCPSNCAKQGEVCNEDQECIHGCEGGYWGRKCETPCPSFCKQIQFVANICDEENGNCLYGCHHGYWSPYCNKTCSTNCGPFGDICNDTNGQCFSCKSGFWGDTCDKSCWETCSGNVCNKSDGSCIEGCIPGYHGNFCNNTCSITCNQIGQVCDDKTGECITCIDGYWDLYCNRECSTHCAGNNCQQDSAFCFNGCMEAGDEKDWYIGDACDQVIPVNVMITIDSEKTFSNASHTRISWKTNIPEDFAQSYGIQLTAGGFNKTFDASNDPGSYLIRKENPSDDSLIYMNIYRITSEGRRVDIPGSIVSKELTQEQTQSTVISEGLNIGIIGGAAGAVVLLITVAVIIVIIFLRRRKNDRKPWHFRRQNTENNDYVRPPQGSIPLSEVPDITHEPEAPQNEPESAANGATGDYINIAFSTGTREITEERKEKPKKTEKRAEMSGNHLPPKIGRKQNKENRDLVYENTETQNTKIRAPELEKYLSRKGERGIQEEYDKLKASNVEACTVALTDGYGDLNRYKNILPYNHSRVKLTTKKGNDYINASYIRGYNRKEQAYIASQGPNRDSVCDMWLLIWESNTTQIVMVTKCVENIKRKCEEYWPRKVKENKKYGDISITCSTEKVYANYNIKTLTLEKGLETREVHHFHFLTWPDKTPPEHAHSIVEFRNKVRSYDNEDAGPMVVHCSAGVGRTGTLIALDILLDMMEKEEMVDVFNVVNEMRKDRMNMVQTQTQYEFLYEALVDTYKSGTKAIPSTQFIKQYRNLQMDEGMYSNQSKLQEQFKILQLLKGTSVLNDDLLGLKEENEPKNRDITIIPANDKRVELFRDEEGLSNYINALFISTYYNLRGLIVTQEPLPETMDDFWSMVYDYKCPCMIYIRDGAQDEEEAWLPGGEYQTSTFGIISVTTRGKNTENFFLTRDYTITRERSRASHSFRVIEITWDDSTPVPNVRQVLAVLDMMDDSAPQDKQTGPPIILCRNGASKSGLIAAAVHVRQRFQMDKDVDIMHSVRVVSAARSQFIPTLEQYHLLYQLVNECIQDGDVYANI